MFKLNSPRCLTFDPKEFLFDPTGVPFLRDKPSMLYSKGKNSQNLLPAAGVLLLTPAPNNV